MSEANFSPEVFRETKRIRSNERRALVVEDDPAIRALAIVLLQREGFVADAAVNGIEALRLLGEGAYALIVLDLTMPEMSGVELIEYLRRHDASMLRRVIVMTASIPRIRPVLPPEICHVLTKPFELEDFHAAITSCGAEGVEV